METIRNHYAVKTPILGATLLMTLPVLAKDQAPHKGNQPPNIIYILTDDMGYADIGCFGQQKIETPNIDQLAQKGIRFTQNYAGSPISAASRCVTFTGLHSGHAYIRANDELPERGDVWSYAAMLADSTLEGQRFLPAGTVTIYSVLKKAGYTTGCVGKWGLGSPVSESAPNKAGIDFFYGYNCQRQAHTYFPPFLYRNDKREYLPNKLLPSGTPLDEGADPLDEKNYAKYTQSAYSPDLMYREILGFVETNKDKPFFLAWTSTIPHAALQAPERWVKYYLNKFGPEEPYTNAAPYPCRYPHATYAAMISYLDEQIGELVGKLKEWGIYENTVIVFTSDNGVSQGAGMDPIWFGSAKPFKGEPGWGKGTLHEGGLRVPLIVTWGNHIKANTKSELVTASWDIVPTACELAGITPPKTDGISFVSELVGKKQKKHDYLYWEFPESDGQKAIRIGKWKGLIKNIKKEGEANLQLFDLEIDPSEQHNVASEHSDIVKLMRTKIKEAHEDSPIEKFRM